MAAETGLFGLALFAFLIVRGAMAAAKTRRLLAKPQRRQDPDPMSLVMTDEERRSLYAYTAAMTAGLIGWFTCSLFASVAYSWTFYYLLALIIATRELTRARLAATRILEAARVHSTSVPSAVFSQKR